MNYQTALEEAQELANQNQETVLVCGSNDNRDFWCVMRNDAPWMLGDDAHVVLRVFPAAPASDCIDDLRAYSEAAAQYDEDDAATRRAEAGRTW
jgi:hypothetical protein